MKPNRELNLAGYRPMVKCSRTSANRTFPPVQRLGRPSAQHFLRRRQRPWTFTGTRYLFDEHLVALAANLRQGRNEEQDDGGDEQARGERTREEHGRIASRNQHRASQILFHQWPEHEGEQHWGGVEIMLREPIADDAEE